MLSNSHNIFLIKNNYYSFTKKTERKREINKIDGAFNVIRNNKKSLLSICDSNEKSVHYRIFPEKKKRHFFSCLQMCSEFKMNHWASNSKFFTYCPLIDKTILEFLFFPLLLRNWTFTDNGCENKPRKKAEISDDESVKKTNNWIWIMPFIFIKAAHYEIKGTQC